MLDFVKAVTERKRSTGVYVVVWGELHGPYSAEIAPEVAKDYKRSGIDSYMIDELTGVIIKEGKK